MITIVGLQAEECLSTQSTNVTADIVLRPVVRLETKKFVMFNSWISLLDKWQEFLHSTIQEVL